MDFFKDKQERKLDGWRMVNLGNTYFAGMMGKTYILTGEFIDIDIKNKVLYTKSGSYKLGKPDLDFIKKYI